MVIDYTSEFWITGDAYRVYFHLRVFEVREASLATYDSKSPVPISEIGLRCPHGCGEPCLNISASWDGVRIAFAYDPDLSPPGPHSSDAVGVELRFDLYEHRWFFAQPAIGPLLPRSERPIVIKKADGSELVTKPARFPYPVFMMAAPEGAP